MKQTIIVFLLFTNFINAQDFLPEGEIDLKKIQYLFPDPRWLEGDLSEATMNPNSNVIKVESLSKWFDYSPDGSSGMKKTYFESSSDGMPLYLFNHLAISDQGVCPVGYRLPKSSDVQNSYSSESIRFGVRKNMETIFPVKTLNVNMSKCIETYDAFLYAEYPNENAMFWLDSISFNEEWGFRAEVSADTVVIRATQLGTGLPVRCIQNGLGQLKEKTFLYNDLLPLKFKKLINKTVERMVVNPKAKNAQTYNFNLKFDNKGVNISNAFSYSPEDNDFLFSLNEEIQNFDVFPYVEKTPIRISSKVKIDCIETQRDPENEKSIREFIGNDLSPDVQIKYGLSSNKEFKVIGAELSYKVDIYEEPKKVPLLIDNIQVSKITSVHANGPLHAFKSIIPGLGLGGVVKHTSKVGNKYKRRELFKNILFIGGITAGLTAITTKVVSDNYYNRYLDDLYGDNASSNYRIANNNNKVFISAISFYALLGAIDIGFTIPIGLSQKVKQKRINKKIKSDGGIVFRRP